MLDTAHTIVIAVSDHGSTISGLGKSILPIPIMRPSAVGGQIAVVVIGLQVGADDCGVVGIDLVGVNVKALIPDVTPEFLFIFFLTLQKYFSHQQTFH